jgi:hypothetical protein
MAKQRKPSAFQDMGGGVYRVTGAVQRSAKTGRYVTRGKTPDSAAAMPSQSKAARAKKSR